VTWWFRGERVKYIFYDWIKLERNWIDFFWSSFSGRMSSNASFHKRLLCTQYRYVKRIRCNFDRRFIDSVLYSPRNHARNRYKLFVISIDVSSNVSVIYRTTSMIISHIARLFHLISKRIYLMFLGKLWRNEYVRYTIAFV